jgi:hypothetical protein
MFAVLAFILGSSLAVWCANYWVTLVISGMLWRWPPWWRYRLEYYLMALVFGVSGGVLALALVGFRAPPQDRY